jgi:hypothetical protein
MSLQLTVRAMRRALGLLAFAILCMPPEWVCADEIDDVTIPLQAYLDGHASGELRHFERAFAPDAMLIGVKDGRYAQRSAADYIRASASGRPAADEPRRRRWIRSIQVDGRVATAVIELDYPDMRAFDHMSLIRFDDGWRIVLKAYDARSP